MELYEISNHTSLSHLRVRSAAHDKTVSVVPYRLDEHVGNVSRLDASLDSWVNHLPSSLEYGHVACRTDRIANKQALLLQLR